MNLSTRIYKKLENWKYTEKYIFEYIQQQKKILKRINAFLIFIAFIGIIGWYKYEQLKLFWFVILIISQGFRLIQNLLLPSSDKLFNLKNSVNFYSHNLLDLENLFYELYKGEDSAKIERKFNKFREEEREMLRHQVDDKIKISHKKKLLAEKASDDYLIELKNNIHHE